MKYLNLDGVAHLWSKIKALVDAKQDALVSGMSIKTVNGETLLGSGDIAIDLSLFKVVTELPTSGIDENKVYLVPNGQTDGTNVYTEYIYANSKWEILGEYKSDVDLSDYVTTEQLESATSTALSEAEKEWVEDQLFAKLFTGSITASPSSVNFAGSSVTVTYTLTTKYDGTLVDLDSVPSGWTKAGTGTYTKAATISASTGSSINSGSVSCVYKGNTKTIGAAGCTNVKDSYILLSTATALTTSDLDSIATNGTKINSGNSIAGDKTISITAAGSYVYFVIANTSTLKNVQQLGLDYLSDKAGASVTRTNYGTYKVYRSANSMAVGSQTVTIS